MTKIEKEDYQISIKIPFKAIDSVEAKRRARLFKNALESILTDEEIDYKLQKKTDGKPPTGISL